MATPAPLAVFVQLSLLTTTGDAITVTAADTVITVTLPRLRLRHAVLGPLADRGQRCRLLASLHEGLQIADLTVQFQVRRRVVAQLRPQSQPTLVSRLLGLGAVEVRIIPYLLALLRW
jgi:hypothetical protein